MKVHANRFGFQSCPLRNLNSRHSLDEPKHENKQPGRPGDASPVRQAAGKATRPTEGSPPPDRAGNALAQGEEGDDAAASAPTPSSGEAPRRRRRGRRGGRRGRRSTDTGTLPNAGVSDSSADVPEDNGDEGEADE